MDIILNTEFNNPNLPVIPQPGFFDRFNREEADFMGLTNDHKMWENHTTPNNSPAVWGITSNETAKMKWSGTQHHVTVVDALTTNGTLEGVLASRNEEEAENVRFGFALRVIDARNMIMVSPNSPTANNLAIGQIVDGNYQNLETGLGVPLLDGDTLRVEALQTNILVYVNGELISSTETEDFLGETKFGLYAFSGARPEWESIEMTPA